MGTAPVLRNNNRRRYFIGFTLLLLSALVVRVVFRVHYLGSEGPWPVLRGKSLQVPSSLGESGRGLKQLVTWPCAGNGFSNQMISHIATLAAGSRVLSPGFEYRWAKKDLHVCDRLGTLVFRRWPAGLLARPPLPPNLQAVRRPDPFGSLYTQFKIEMAYERPVSL